LADRNARALLVVPGDLANLGGVHVSNLEAVQNLYGEIVTDGTARRSLGKTMRAGWRRATAIADRLGVSERAAVELAAVDAMMKRSLQRPDAARTSLERQVISDAGRVAHARRVVGPTAPRTSRSAGRAGSIAQLEAHGKAS